MKPLLGLLLASLAVWTTGSAAAVVRSEPGLQSFVLSSKGSRTGPDFPCKAKGNCIRPYRVVKVFSAPISHWSFIPHLVASDFSCPMISDDSAESTVWNFEVRRPDHGKPQSLGVVIYYSKSPCVFNGVVIITVTGSWLIRGIDFDRSVIRIDRDSSDVQPFRMVSIAHGYDVFFSVARVDQLGESLIKLVDGHAAKSSYHASAHPNAGKSGGLVNRGFSKKDGTV